MAIKQGHRRNRALTRTAALFTAVCAACLLAPATTAQAEGIIDQPTAHPDYRFEAEPHVLVGYVLPDPNEYALGIGFRGTIEIVDPGFVKTINNTVGIGFGADFLFGKDDDCSDGKCKWRTRGWVPVVMQWNFFLHEQWSVFGEPGFGISLHDGRRHPVEPIFYAGGRWHFSKYASLTMRLGYPSSSVGVSFFL